MRTRIVRARGGSATDLTAPTPPAFQELASSATTASVTWTHPGAPGGTTYAIAVADEDNAAVTPDSGSGLGPYVFPVSAGKSYSARLRATGADGQTAQSSTMVVVPAAVTGAWTEIGRVSFLGATEQTFSTTGDKTVVLADASEITVNASMSVGTISGCNVGVDAERGLVCDVPAGLSSHAPRVRVAMPVSPSVASTDDLLVSILWRCTQPTSTSTTSRGLVGVTTSSGTEASTEFSGMVLQHTNPDGANIQSRKDSTVSTVAAAPSGWRSGSVLMQTDIRVTSGSVRTLLATATSRNVSTGAATYVADIGGPPFGPLASTAAALFQGATIYPLMYSWNGGSSGPAVDAAIEEIVVYKRATSRVP